MSTVWSRVTGPVADRVPLELLWTSGPLTSRRACARPVQPVLNNTKKLGTMLEEYLGTPPPPARAVARQDASSGPDSPALKPFPDLVHFPKQRPVQKMPVASTAFTNRNTMNRIERYFFISPSFASTTPIDALLSVRTTITLPYLY